MSKSARQQLRDLGITVSKTMKEAEAQELLEQLQSSSSEPEDNDYGMGGASPRG